MNNEKDVGKDKPCKGRDSHGNPVASDNRESWSLLPRGE